MPLAQAAPAKDCHQIAITGELSSGDSFQRNIGSGFVLRLNPEPAGANGEFNGWNIILTPADNPDQDYIYPVSPPLRFNGLQTLGPSYGDDAKTSLGYAHEMHFLLNAADYKHIQPLLTSALWPYSAPNPDRAGPEYVEALEQLTTGLLKLTVASYDLDPANGSIRHMKFRAEFTAPASFAFDLALQSKPITCPASRKWTP